MKDHAQGDMCCEVASKIGHILVVSHGLLKQDDLTPSQAQVLERIIAEVKEIQLLTDNKRTDSGKRLKLNIPVLLEILGKLAELAMRFFDSGGS